MKTENSKVSKLCIQRDFQSLGWDTCILYEVDQLICEDGMGPEKNSGATFIELSVL